MDRRPRLRFALSREVELPKRAGAHEAGIDFFVPKNLTVEDIQKANKDVLDVTISEGNTAWPSAGHICLHVNEDGFEKVRKNLGIPEKLYNEGIKGTNKRKRKTQDN